MIIYHGTAERHLKSILQTGIAPRGRSAGNWKHSVTSNPRAVYLTVSYALHFASNACRPKEDKNMLVLEVETDLLNPYLLAPDEDFLEQGTRGYKANDKPVHPIRLYQERYRLAR